jgi:hypothetical protein
MAFSMQSTACRLPQCAAGADELAAKRALGGSARVPVVRPRCRPSAARAASRTLAAAAEGAHTRTPHAHRRTRIAAAPARMPRNVLSPGFGVGACQRPSRELIARAAAAPLSPLRVRALAGRARVLRPASRRAAPHRLAKVPSAQR